MASDPLQNLFSDIKRILDFVEFKDRVAAEEAETTESKNAAEMWINAMEQNDSYVSYRQYWTIPMFQEILPNMNFTDINRYIQNPYSIPIQYHDKLLEKGRAKFLASYTELNDYYRTLAGLPPLGTPESDFIILSEPIRNQLHIDKSGIPVHMLSELIQNNYMATDEYQQVLANNPDKAYLRYLGSYKIDPYVARKAKDFDIIRYPVGRSDINPNLLNAFSSLYADYREYVMVTLYNKNLESIYVGYREFMHLLIIEYTLLQINNRAIEALSDRRFMDDSALYMILSMYGIPDKLMLPAEVRRNLAINILKLVKEKATDDVYYDLIQILGYQDVTISKLMLMKGQTYDGNNFTATGKNKPYFVQIDLTDKNPYDTITSGNAPMYSYEEITGNDPMWWNTDDVKKILDERVYSETDTKYLTVSAAVNQMEYLFESIYFPKMILDNPVATDRIMISIPEVFGMESQSLYDLILYIICANCMMHGMPATIQSEEYLYPMAEWESNDLSEKTVMGEFRDRFFASAGFNFDMDLESFQEFLETTQYVDKTRIMTFMENLNINTPSDISWIYSNVIIPMRECLEDKIATADTRRQYLEYEAIYKALFTYDATRNKFLDSFESPLEIIQSNLGISASDMDAFKHFYPRNLDGSKVTVDQYNSSTNTSRYSYPFLSRSNMVDWNIRIIVEDPPYGDDDRGTLYFHDILNCQDVRLLTNPNGTRIFMDYNDGEVGWEINQKAVDKAIELLEKMDDGMLANAYFQVKTPIIGSTQTYQQNQKLPADIRNGLFKQILIEKVRMDCQGLADPPTTYFELLRRKNNSLYQLLFQNNLFDTDRQNWIDTVMKVITVIETDLSMHLKYFEQSVLGEELFFKPLITLIKHFKSTLVDFAKTGLKYQFGDKIDAGGNSNMFKLFDEVAFIISFITLANNDYDTVFGLYDTIHKTSHHIIMKDRCESLIMTIGEGFAAEKKETTIGSIRMVDEMKFFLNGEEVDPDGQPSHWISGEPGTGRWSDEMKILMATRNGHSTINGFNVDLEGWKDFVESYNPI